ncbi:3-keto-5-aminohexanoate cleavage protein [Rhodospirillaceae bacterium SYSU D60014]|uniref:3-keto-5-aminohexanoate cleavage protein n=1 Tax=Virgifigura deserti TaxID=2268457 RepID=UPI000E666A71
MPHPAIIAVAITGSQPTKDKTPAVPITTAEQIESTQEAFEAGASLVHIHVRDDHGHPSSDPERYAAVQEGVRKHCPGMIVQFSTGGRGRTPAERGLCLDHRPDMASLATGSVNFATMIYENPPDLIDALAGSMLDRDIKPEIEIFDLAMLYNARDLVERGLVRPPLHVQFVMGIPNALPAREQVLDFLISELEDQLPGATWTAAATGRSQLVANRWALARGGHVRTGLEDNIYFERGRLAQSNAELVARVAALCGEYDRRPATPAEARSLLGLQPVQSVPGQPVVSDDTRRAG